MEAHDEHAGEHQPDPIGAETGPVVPEEPTSDRSADESEAGALSTDPTIVEPDPEADEREGGHKLGDDEARNEGSVEGEDDEPGILTGTAAEQAPGVGGAGEHPAPAAVRDPETGGIHVAGEPPAGTVASGLAGSELRETPSGATEEEARERLNAEQEPEQIETERPDLGTE